MVELNSRGLEMWPHAPKRGMYVAKPCHHPEYRVCWGWEGGGGGGGGEGAGCKPQSSNDDPWTQRGLMLTHRSEAS